jgi:hypothetical protein
VNFECFLAPHMSVPCYKLELNNKISRSKLISSQTIKLLHKKEADLSATETGIVVTSNDPLRYLHRIILTTI